MHHRKNGSATTQYNEYEEKDHETHETKVRFYYPGAKPPKLPPFLYPAPQRPLPPAIYHVTTIPKNPTTLSALIHQSTNLPKTLIKDLIPFGSIYIQNTTGNTRNPTKPLRTTTDIPILTSSQLYIRIHASPRRYHPLYPLSITHQTPHFVIIHKPPNLPTHPTTDNLAENALHQTRILLHNQTPPIHPETLHTVSRLDVPTSGLILITLTKKATQYFHHNPPTKTYHVLTRYPLEPTFLHHHYHRNHPLLRPLHQQASNDNIPPMLLDLLQQPPNGYISASLEITRCEEFGELYEVQVRLITGRTHQIRIQFGGIGYGIVGDRKYGGVDGGFMGKWDVVLGEEDLEGVLGLCAVEVGFTWEGKEVLVRVEGWWKKERFTGLLRGIERENGDDVRKAVEKK